MAQPSAGRITLTTWLLALLCVLSSGRSAAASHPQGESEVVILLHGLARSHRSMRTLQESLEDAGYSVCNVGYPSREHDIATLARQYVLPRVEQCVTDPQQRINFVTHSLGGIIVRELAATGALSGIGRVVMLGPPNHGSEIVDALGTWPLFGLINGPAGRQLGTSEWSLPGILGPATFHVGVIAGRRSVNPFLSLIIPGPDDGKVSLESASLEGMRDLIVVDVSHPFLLRDREVLAQTIEFLSSGCFVRRDDIERVGRDVTRIPPLPCERG